MATLKLGETIDKGATGIIHGAGAGGVGDSFPIWSEVTTAIAAAIAAIPPATPGSVGLPFFNPGRVPFGNSSGGTLTQDDRIQWNPSTLSIDIFTSNASDVALRVGFDATAMWAIGRRSNDGALLIRGNQAASNGFVITGPPPAGGADVDKIAITAAGVVTVPALGSPGGVVRAATSTGLLSSSAINFADVQPALASASGSISVNNQRITNLATPVAGTDAVNKAYADGLATASAGLGLFVSGSTINVGANADGSIVVNAHDVQVGVINDTQHGLRSGAGLHALATTTVAGFMPAADRNTLANATFITRSATAAPAAGFSLGSLTTGLLLNTVSGSVGTLSTAVAGTDYVTPSVTVTAGNGLTGGGALSGSISIDVVAADSSIIVGADSIRVGVIANPNLAAHIVDGSKFRQSAALSLVGNPTNALADVQDISTSSNDRLVMTRSGAIVWTTLLASDIPTLNYEAPLTFTSGLTRTSNTIRGDYITGISGGQAWRGGTVNGDALSIDASFGADGGPFSLRAQRFTWNATSPASSNVAVGTEEILSDWGTRSRRWSTGSVATQREHVFRAPTYSFVAASTITTAVTVTITGAPNAGPNTTITTPVALHVESGATRLDGDLRVGHDLAIINDLQGTTATFSGRVTMSNGFSVVSSTASTITGSGVGSVCLSVSSGDVAVAGNLSVGPGRLSVTGTGIGSVALSVTAGDLTINGGSNLIVGANCDATFNASALVGFDTIQASGHYGYTFVALHGSDAAHSAIGFFGVLPQPKLTINGSCGGVTALQQLMSALSVIGLFINNTTL